jgi:iron complex outermembrane recepter protein
MRANTIRSLLLTTAATMALSSSGWAQQQQAQTQQAQVSTGIEEIVVTARQRAESLQEIPLAIAAFTAEDIKKGGFQNLGDIAMQSAGVQFNPNISGVTAGRFNSVIRMRGVSVLGQLPHLQATALFVDGVYSLGGAQVLPIQDLERVEIIKGPQSAFFGRNTFAGAINYITKKPDLENYEGAVDISGATYDQYDVNVQHTGPLVEGKLGYLVNARLYNKGSMFTATDGGELGKQGSKSASLSLLAKPTDTLNFKLRAFYQEDDDGPASEGKISGRLFDTCAGKTVTALSVAGAQVGSRGGETITLSPRNYTCGPIPQPGDVGAPIMTSNTSLRPAGFARVRSGFDFERSVPLPEVIARPNFLIDTLINRKFIKGVPSIDDFGMRRNTFRGSLNADWEFAEGYKATLTAGYNDMAVNWLRDFDVSDSEVWYSADPQTGKDKGAELRISSPGDDRLRWLGGATYYKQTFVTNGGGGLLASNCWNSTCSIGPVNAALAATGGDRAEVWAGYGNVSYDIFEQLTLDLEFRYMQDTRTNTQAFGASVRNLEQKNKQKTPRVILTYKPSDETTIYGQASRGALPGVINGLVAICSSDAFTVPYTNPRTGLPSTASECDQISSQSPGGNLISSTPPQYLDALEAGVKQSFDDGRGKVNLTGYYYKWKNFPTPVSIIYVRDADDPARRDRIPNASPNTLGINTSGSAKFRGAELEMAYAPTDNWNLNGNISYNKSEFTEFVNVGLFSNEVFNFGGINPVTGFRRALTTDPTTISAQGNLNGKSPTRYPEWMGNFSATYTDELVGDWTWFARGDAIYFGKTYVDLWNLSTTAAYWLFNTRAGVEKDNLRIELYVRNLFNEDKWAAANAVSDFSQTDFGVNGAFSFSAQGINVVPQDKRTFGIRMNYKF